jgi:hypothetical protein
LCIHQEIWIKVLRFQKCRTLFRSTASTILNEAQFNRDGIEAQLAHADGSVRGVYNSAEWLPGRRDMLLWWADYLDGLRRNACGAQK